MTHEDRVWHHEMETLEGIHEHAERIASLEELALALADCRNTTCDDCVRRDYPEGGCSLDGVMRELGLKVE